METHLTKDSYSKTSVLTENTQTLENFYVALEKCKRHGVTSTCPIERIEGMLAGKSAQVTEKETRTTCCRRMQMKIKSLLDSLLKTSSPDSDD